MEKSKHSVSRNIFNPRFIEFKKSSLMIFKRCVNMNFAYKNRDFYCKGYYIDIAEKNVKNRGIYEKRLKQDKLGKQFTFDPF